jgi:hypothetical protein
MDEQAIPHELMSGIELTKNAKSDRQWTIKARCAPGEEMAAAERAAQVDDWLEARYPR